MTDANTTPDPAPTNHRLANHRTSHLIFICLIVFVCGMVVGSGVTVIVAVKHIRESIAHPELRADRWTQRITRRLHLDESQAERVRPVIAASVARFEAIHHDIYPRIEKELDRMEQDVAAALPADKAAAWREHFNTLRREWITRPAVKP